MNALVQEVAIPDNGASFRRGGTIDYHVLADHVIIPDPGDRISPLIPEILRLSGDHGSIENAIPLTETGTAHDTGVRHDHAIIPDLYILIDIGEWVNRYVIPQFRAWIYIS